MGNIYRRNIEQLEQKASLWWPKNLSDYETSTSIIPLLLMSQNDFISLLTLCKKNPQDIFTLLEASNFPTNLFVKHLVVLSDFGGERLQRLNRNFDDMFPKNRLGKRELKFLWKEKEYNYTFKVLPNKALNNKNLRIDGASLTDEYPLDDLYKDVIMILLFGSSIPDETLSEGFLSNCEVGNLLGKSDELEQFIKQRYIIVSRITGGAKANTLGQVAQQYVIDFLKDKLSTKYDIQNNGKIPGVTHNEGRTETTFDIVVSKNNKSVAIEVSFQVTTNSTIERKAGQAKARYDMVTESGNYIAYIIDGAGNFQRRSALSTIFENSQCTVAYSIDEFNVLADFIKEKLS